MRPRYVKRYRVVNPAKKQSANRHHAPKYIRKKTRPKFINLDAIYIFTINARAGKKKTAMILLMYTKSPLPPLESIFGPLLSSYKYLIII